MKVEEIDEIKGTEIREIFKKLFYIVSSSILNSVEKSIIFSRSVSYKERLPGFPSFTHYVLILPN